MQVDCFPDAPREWIRAVVNQVARVNPIYRLDKGKEYPFVEMANVAEDFGGIKKFDLRTAEASGLSRFKLNDILFGKITPCAENGKVALVRDLPTDFGLGSTEFIVLSPRPGNEPRFVYALACSNPVRGRAISRMEGSTGRLRVTEDTFTKWLLVPVPATEEQEGIAHKLDAVDKVIERTRAAIAKARRLKRGIFQQFIESGVGRISAADRPGSFLAPGWRLAPTGTLLAQEPKNGISPQTETQPVGYLTFSIAAVRDGKIDLLNKECWKFARIPYGVAAEFFVRRGDLLIVRGNASPELVGCCGIVQEFPEGCFYPDILKRVVFAETADGVLPEYAVLAWNHGVIHNQVLKRAKTSNGTLKINSRDVKKIVMPVPPKPAQRQIVKTIRAVEDQILALKESLDALARLKRGLTQDLLTGKVRVGAAQRLVSVAANGQTP